MGSKNPLDAFDAPAGDESRLSANPLDAFDNVVEDAPRPQAPAQKTAPPPPLSTATVDPESEKLQKMHPALRYPILAARGAARAIPGSTDAGAAFQAGLTYLGATPPDVKSTGPFSERFASARRKQEAIDRAAERSYPAATYGSQIAASLAVPFAGPASRISSVASPVVGSVLGRSLGLGAVGAGYGAASGFGDGGDLNQRIESAKSGAIVGGLGGAAIPAVVDIAGAGLGKAAQYFPFRSAASKAEDQFIRGMQSAGRHDAGMTKAQADAALSSGQPVLPIDLGGAQIKQMAKTASHVNPEARDVLLDALQKRNVEQQGRLYDFASNLVGKNLSDPTVTQQIQSAARSVNTPAYDAAFNKGASVWSPTLERVSNHPWVKRAIPDAIDEANANAVAKGLPPIQSPFVQDAAGNMTLRLDASGKPVRPSLEFWDIVKKNIDGRIRAAESTPTTRGDPNTVRLGSSIVGALTKELDRIVPEYGAARAGASRYLGEEDAYRFGSKFFSAKKAADVNAGMARIRGFTPQEREFAQHSYMSERVQRFMNAPKNRDVGKMASDPVQKAKDVAILGKPKADELEAYLLRESVMHNSLARLGGSDTSPNIISALKHTVGSSSGAMAGAATGAWDALWNGNLDPVSMAKRAAVGAIGGAFIAHRVVKSEKVALELANRLVSEDPAVWQAAVKAISQNPKGLVALRRAEASIPALAVDMRELSSPAEKKALPAPTKTPLLAPPKKDEKRKARASGGRTMRKAHTAQSLIAAVKRAKKDIQSQTETILAQPDEHVVKALAVASKNI